MVVDIVKVWALLCHVCTYHRFHNAMGYCTLGYAMLVECLQGGMVHIIVRVYLFGCISNIGLQTDQLIWTN